MARLFRNVSICLAAVALAGGATAAGVAKHPITFDDLAGFKRLADPAISPDGQWVALSVGSLQKQSGRIVGDLWLIAVHGAMPPRRLTVDWDGASDISWAPDNRRIAFSAKRAGDAAAQIYILDIAGQGDPVRLSTLSTGAAHPRWSPDGRAILFESMVYPDARDDADNMRIAADRSTRKAEVRVYDGGPPRIWNNWLDDRRPTIFVQSLDPGATPRDILSATRLRHAPGFWGVSCCDSANPILQPIWSPDSREIVFTASTALASAAVDRMPYQLYTMAADGAGEPRPITPVGGRYDALKFSPDGSTLFFKYVPVNGEVYNLEHLEALSWRSGGTPRLIAQAYDLSIEDYAISADGRTIYLVTPELGRKNIYAVPATGGRPKLRIAPGQGGYTVLATASQGKAADLVALYGSATEPTELVDLDPGAASPRFLTQFNSAAAASIDWQPLQRFEFTNSRGDVIHNMIALPPNFDPARKYPLFTMVHGGADYYNEDQVFYRWNYHLLAASGVVVLLTDYTGSTSHGERFAQAIKNDPLKGPAQDVNQAVDEAVKRYPFIDGSRVCAGGASYGGHIANWLEATTTRYRCIISHAGLTDQTLQWGEGDHQGYPEQLNGGPPWSGSKIYTDQNPLAFARNWQTPMLLSVGERDFRVPIGNTLLAYETLRAMHVPTRLLIWPRAGHWIGNLDDSRRFYQEAQAWLRTYLVDRPIAGSAQ